MTTFADISHHQATVDLAAYAAAGHDRIILKATEGTGFTDPAFTARYRRAGELGLARVAYHFDRAKFNGADQFDHLYAVVQAAGGLTARDRLCLDSEDPDTPDRAAASAREFTTRAGVVGVTRGLVYTYNYFAVHHAIAPVQFPPGWQQLWLADYTAGQADTDIELGAGWTRGQVVARQYIDLERFAGIGSLCDASRVLNDWLTPTIKEDDMALSDEDKQWIREILGAGGGKTVTGVTEGAYNDLHAELTSLRADVDSLKQQPPAQPPVLS